MAVHLVRHADAGRRGSWHGPDGERPLVAAGQAQAQALALELVLVRPRRILSSPLVRCIQTVQPLADALGVVVEPHPALAEGADTDESWALLESLAGDEEAVLCSHGDVIPPLLERLERRGIPVVGSEQGVAKGSVWTVEAAPDGRLTTARLGFAP
jgi:8-oxo-dGTP diphosphatase